MTQACRAFNSPLDGRTRTADLKKQPRSFSLPGRCSKWAQYLILWLMSMVKHFGLFCYMTSDISRCWEDLINFYVIFQTCQWIRGYNYRESNLQGQNITMHLKWIRTYSFLFSFPCFFMPFCFSTQMIRLTLESAVGSAFHLSVN